MNDQRAGAGELTALFNKGIDLFNCGDYFECHEVLEELWKQQTGEDRQFTQGLIQIAVAIHHLKRNNEKGALKLFDRGLARLKACSAGYAGIDVPSLIDEVERQRTSLDASAKPQIRY